MNRGFRHALAFVALGVSSAGAADTQRPYDAKLMRLSEILGAVHYLRELCGASERQQWRDDMQALIEAEGTSAVRRARLVASFNKGYRSYRRTYQDCTKSARTAIGRFVVEGAEIATGLAEGKL